MELRNSGTEQSRSFPRFLSSQFQKSKTAGNRRLRQARAVRAIGSASVLRVAKIERDREGKATPLELRIFWTMTQGSRASPVRLGPPTLGEGWNPVGIRTRSATVSAGPVAAREWVGAIENILRLVCANVLRLVFDTVALRKSAGGAA